MGQPHALCNGSGRDVARILFGGKFDNRLNRGRSTLFGIPAVYSTEPLRQPGADSLEAIGAEPGSRIGFGSFVSVTGSAGLRLAGIVINDIAGAQNTAD